MFRHWKALLDLPRAAWTVALAQLINKTGGMMVPFLSLYLSRERGFSAAEASTALAAFGAGALAGSPLSGRLMDRVGPGVLMRISLLSSGTVALLIPLLTSPWGVASGVFLFSLLAELFRPANLTLLSSLAPPHQRKQVFALHRLAVNLGMSVGPVVGGLLAERWFTGIFLVDGGTTILAGLFLWAALREPAKGTGTGGASAQGPSVWRDTRMMGMLGAMWLVVIVFMQLEGPTSLFLVEYAGMRPSLFGALYAVNTVLIVLVEVPLNGATAHWSHRRNMGTGALLVALGVPMLGLAIPLGVPGAVLGMVVLTFGEMILFPGASNLVASWAPEQSRGRYMGAYSLTFGLGWLVGPASGTWTLRQWGPLPLWLGSLALGLLGWAVMLRVTSRAESAPH